MQALNLKQLQDLIAAGKPLLVDFWATWCGPCKALAPILETLSLDYEKIQFVKVDIDKDNIAKEFEIRSIPTLRIYSGGKLLSAKVGMSSGADLEKWLKGIPELKPFLPSLY